MRKKLSEMTPFERVKSRLKGLSLEEAEDVAVTILGQVVAKHVYVLNDGEEYFKHLIVRIGDASNAWAEENTFSIALARALGKRDNAD